MSAPRDPDPLLARLQGARVPQYRFVVRGTVRGWMWTLYRGSRAIRHSQRLPTRAVCVREAKALERSMGITAPIEIH